jgi:hypothetical protein
MTQEDALSQKAQGKDHGTDSKELISVDGGFCGCGYGNISTAKGYSVVRSPRLVFAYRLLSLA